MLERAAQKLRLDQLVIQQGRTQTVNKGIYWRRVLQRCSIL